MVRCLADEDFNNDILRALRRRRPSVDLVRVQDVGLSGCADAEVLERAAQEGRVLLTHDAATLVPSAFARLDAGRVMRGVLVAPQGAALALVIADLELIAEVSTGTDWRDRVTFLPLR